MCRRRRQLVKQAAKVRAKDRAYRVSCGGEAATGECLGLWMVVRLVTDDGPRKSAELERHTRVKSDLGSCCCAWVEERFNEGA